MNTQILTEPTPELKQHMNDLHQDVDHVSQDLKNQASAGFEEIKTEARNRIQGAKGAASDLFEAFRNFAAEHPFKAFGVGVLAGMVLATWRRN